MKLRLPRVGEDISHLEAFDFTKLTAINTCPKWGIIRYSLHKSMSNVDREMPLEAGEACHQVFSAVRLLDLLYYGADVYPDAPVQELVEKRFKKLFAADKWDTFYDLATRIPEKEFAAVDAALFIMESSGFTDNGIDKKRTVSNIEQALILYTQTYPFGKHVPLIKGDFVGVENAFEIILETNGERYRFTGKIDGVHTLNNDPSRIFIVENKTGMVNDVWESSFRTSHQPTGYMMATNVLLDMMPEYSEIHGLSLPLPRSMLDGMRTVTIHRNQDHFFQWSVWAENAINLYKEYIDLPLDAPMFTHSCSRYFRTCSFIDLCTLPRVEQDMMLEEMSIKEWSPLHDEQV